MDLSPLPLKFIAASNRRERSFPSMTPGAPAASKTPRRLPSRISMPIAALVWAGFPSIPRSPGGKSASSVSCIGGHLAFRAAFQSDVRATVCYYGTGIHDGKLGQDADAGSLARTKEIRGELLMIFGTKDPHVPDAGRETIDRALQKSGIRHNTLLYPAEHAFTRDEARASTRKRPTSLSPR